MINKLFLSFALVLSCTCLQAQTPGGAIPQPGVDSNFYLFLLIGQSNMAGRGEVDSAGREAHPGIWMLDKNCHWVPAKDPVHFDKKEAGVGPALGFATAIQGAVHPVKIGLIPCAAGGSSISRWEPGAYHDQTNSHPYDDMVKRLDSALQYGVLKGILWHQGEGDSSPENIRKYPDRLMTLIGRIRSKPGLQDVPFVAGELGYFGPTRDAFNAMIRKMPDRVPRMLVVSAAGLMHKGDNLHFNTASARELGKRYAAAILQLWSKFPD